VICSHLEKILGKKLKRKPWTAEELVVCIYAFINFEKNGINLPVEVRLYDPKSCKIEYKEVVKKEVIVDPACLGIQEEAS